MKPDRQLTDSNDYTPSDRAKKAQTIASSRSGYRPDGPIDGGAKAPDAADQPKDQHVGGKVKSNTQNTESSATEPYDAGRGAPEKGTI